ncbi:hypothetical protein [Hymenobacter canadensis]|uniref:Uncharacterized protein n=1 Tax=Hymenobacter canadensis TaxID=2999067 RepID=A0ABY7LWN0_9BACT|nr:hypothetical protein [Hymenobacter canadensis]WBA44004.1 hypothetical protein O3303_20785 [Hymenobacter canadensis]
MILVAGCEQRQNLATLTYRQHLYVTPDKTVFTGVGVREFDDGQQAELIRFEQGIPSGTWQAFGYQGEIIQEGSYRVLPLPSGVHAYHGLRVKRLNLFHFREGNYDYDELLVISPDSNLYGSYTLAEFARRQPFLVFPQLRRRPLTKVVITSKEF